MQRPPISLQDIILILEKIALARTVLENPSDFLGLAPRFLQLENHLLEKDFLFFVPIRVGLGPSLETFFIRKKCEV